MNYRLQANILGSFLIAGGIGIIAYATLQAQTVAARLSAVCQAQDLTSALIAKCSAEASAASVGWSVTALVGLGFVLIGTLATFSAPEQLVPSEIMNRAVSPPAVDLAVVLEGILPKGRAIHAPKVTLGGESQVLLIYSHEANSSVLELPSKDGGVAWGPTQKALKPTGIELMKGYEKALSCDFLGLDVLQLGRLLSKAIVPELQLASGFSLTESATNRVEADWIKPTIAHTCLSEESTPHPELCYLCSSVACALAKATGKSVRIEDSRSAANPLSVTTTYLILEGRG